jgi:hypothetical protein
MNKIMKGAALAALVVGLNAGMAVATMPHEAVAVTEGSPEWNCYTMGNLICGVDTYFESPEGRGAVLPVATDGRMYVSWENGTVTPATEVQREAAWSTCVDYATGGDASMYACDADFQNAGDRFSK